MTATTAALTTPVEFRQPPADPFALLATWAERARELGVADVTAMALSTVDGAARVSSRIVRLEEIDPSGLLFTTHSTSRKGREFETTTAASALLFWRETGQQVIMSGPVRRVPDAESDALWASRPRIARVVSTVSNQSMELMDEEELQRAVAELAESDEPLPRPERWCGYRFQPKAFEFWQSSPDRLHLRLRYDLAGNGWTTMRLQP